jgi:hypothetical protein
MTIEHWKKRPEALLAVQQQLCEICAQIFQRLYREGFFA